MPECELEIQNCTVSVSSELMNSVHNGDHQMGCDDTVPTRTRQGTATLVREHAFPAPPPSRRLGFGIGSADKMSAAGCGSSARLEQRWLLSTVTVTLAALLAFAVLTIGMRLRQVPCEPSISVSFPI